mgnify:CR=1 FL=1|tara:strand:+ start:171 stop:938 length:768 start_codon:yes stop_codon:yes gene_type:complete
MAWSTPRTWVAEEVITAEIMNVHVRDQFTFLGTHGHSSNSGDGGDDLGGIDEIIFADATADPAAIGEMQRNGSALKYHDGTGVMFIGRDAAAGTPSLRTLGVGGTQAADGTHLHTLRGSAFDEVEHIAIGTGFVTANPAVGTYKVETGATTSVETTLVTTTGATSVVYAGFSMLARASGGAGTGVKVQVQIDGTTVGAQRQIDTDFTRIIEGGTVLKGSGTYTVAFQLVGTSVATRWLEYSILGIHVLSAHGSQV